MWTLAPRARVAVALAVGSHTLRVVATDGASNTATVTVAFVLGVTVDSLTSTTQQLYSLGQIDSKGILTSLLAKLKHARALILSGDVASAKTALQPFIAVSETRLTHRASAPNSKLELLLQ